MRKLTILDRMIIESISKSEKNITQIQIDTTLPLKICNKIIENLLTQNVILLSKNMYSLNSTMSADLLSFLKDESELILQIKALICECIQEKSDDISFYKVSMNESESKILGSMFYNLESFLKGLKKSKGPTKDETFVFWGKENYAKAIHSYIS